MLLIKKLILASRSPRRQLLLKQLGLPFEVIESGIDEVFDFAQSPSENVKSLSFQKARTVAEAVSDAIVVGADTIVVLDKELLGKPSDHTEAFSMLKMLSGKTHEVYTGFTLFDRPSNQFTSDFEMTNVTFRTLEDPEIEEYIATGSPFDKAGGYGIQDDYGAIFVEKINGCFYNVVGFPVTKFYLAMRNFQKQLRLER